MKQVEMPSGCNGIKIKDNNYLLFVITEEFKTSTIYNRNRIWDEIPLDIISYLRLDIEKKIIKNLK